MRVLLVVRRHCITQVDATSKQPLADYCYKDIEALIKVGRLNGRAALHVAAVGDPDCCVFLQHPPPLPSPSFPCSCQTTQGES